MAFVNELIPEEEKVKFDFPVTTLRDGSKPTLWKWAIDRERRAFLVHAKSEGGSYEGTPEDKYYVLSWHGSLVNFVGTSKFSGNMNDGYILYWNIRGIRIPPELTNAQHDVLALIREALDVMGWLYDRSRITAINVDFDLPSAN